jgi:hypothetical protein
VTITSSMQDLKPVIDGDDRTFPVHALAPRLWDLDVSVKNQPLGQSKEIPRDQIERRTGAGNDHKRPGLTRDDRRGERY